MFSNTILKKRAKTTLETITRWSYVAKGILFFSLGFVILYDQFGGRSEMPNRKEILELWTFEPIGKLLLAGVFIVFVGHFVWRLFEAWHDPYAKGNSPAGLLYRLTYLLSAISYGALALAAQRLLFTGWGGSNDEKQEYLFDLLQLPGGRWVGLFIGCLLMTWAVVQGQKGLTGSVVKLLRMHHLPRWLQKGIWVCSFFGFLALVVTLGVVGLYIARAAWEQNPVMVKNMDDVFIAIKRLPAGHVWLQLEAFGLCCLGLFMFAMVRYFPFRTA